MRNIPFVKQQNVAIAYENLLIEEGLRLDILVDDLLILELKAQENYHAVWEAQLISYLKLTGKRIGYLINFHVPLMKKWIQAINLLSLCEPLCRRDSVVQQKLQWKHRHISNPI